MNILGLNFGHDASACLVRDGQVVSYVLRERYSRRKHALGLTTVELQQTLERAGITERQIDLCAITSTQTVELVTGLVDGLSIEFIPHRSDPASSPLRQMIQREGVDIRQRLSFSLRAACQGKLQNRYLTELYKQVFAESQRLANDELATVGWLDNYLWHESWQPAPLAGLSGRVALMDDLLRLGFHYPVTVELGGHRIPGYFIFHHMAHAASCFYQSGFERAAILTHDGFGNGVGYQSGLCAYGQGSGIWALSPHHLVSGSLYDRVADALGLGVVGGAGKLMGLSSYGQPRFFRYEFVGNEYDSRARWQEPLPRAWLAHCRESAGMAGHDLGLLGDRSAATAPINADIAASTQKLFEEITLAAVNALHEILRNSDLTPPNLCLSGGTALNCPSNSRLHTGGPFPQIFIEPNCDDGGLATGAALYVWHNLLDQPVRRPQPFMSPYLGGRFSRPEILSLLASQTFALRSEVVQNATAAAAEELAQDRVIGWFEGCSEAGPRALGHRSILANPLHRANWQRVNRIKGREAWRPFAPAVLEEDAVEWFHGCPSSSPYMLFTAQVLNDRIPAVTHVDGSARVQTVGPTAGGFYELIREFKQRTGVPVILNTSFNGPGEPIVETPADAIAFLRSSTLDVVYIEGVRVARR